MHGGQSPHTFSLRPSDARALDGADVLFWIGPALEQPLQRIPPNLRVTRSVAMLEAAGMELLPARELGDSDDAHHDHAAPDGGETAFVDPHLWLSPGNAIAMSEEIARVLSQVDPANAGRYDVNAAQLVQRLTTLDKDLRVKFSDATAPYAVFHDAYQYLEQRYGLHAAGTVTTRRAQPRRCSSARTARQPGQRPGPLPVLRATVSAADGRGAGEGLPIRHAILDPLGSDIPSGAGRVFSVDAPRSPIPLPTASGVTRNECRHDPFPSVRHDHRACVDHALHDAETLCAAQGPAPDPDPAPRPRTDLAGSQAHAAPMKFSNNWRQTDTSRRRRRSTVHWISWSSTGWSTG